MRPHGAVCGYVGYLTCQSDATGNGSTETNRALGCAELRQLSETMTVVIYAKLFCTVYMATEQS